MIIVVIVVIIGGVVITTTSTCIIIIHLFTQATLRLSIGTREELLIACTNDQKTVDEYHESKAAVKKDGGACAELEKAQATASDGAFRLLGRRKNDFDDARPSKPTRTARCNNCK